jgi:hypothetical protein
MRRLLLAICLGLALGIVPLAVAGGLGEKFAQDTAHGYREFAIARGHVVGPRAIFMHVKATPRQRVKVAYANACSKGPAEGEERGHFKERAPVVHRLKKPFDAPDDCTVAALGQLGANGFVKVRLFTRH